MNKYPDPDGKCPAVEPDIDRFPKSIKRSRCTPWFPQPLCSSPQFFSPTSQTPGLVPLLSVFLTTFLIIMFPKAILTYLVLGALSVNALSVPVAREPAPEPECKFPRSLLTDLTAI